MANDIEIVDDLGPVDGVQDILDVLNKDDNKEEKEEEKEDEDEDKSDENELEVNEDEDEEDEVKIKEDEDELAYSSVPKRQEIIKAYPDFFKKFPAVEKAIYREQQFAEIFGTIKDAKSANESLQNYRNLEGQLVKGDIKELFKNLKTNVPDAYDKISDNILETLRDTDQQSYSNVLHQVSKAVIINAFNAGKEIEGEAGEQLQIAAQLLHKWLYKTDKISSYEKPKRAEVTKSEDEISKRELEFNRVQLSNAEREVSDKTRNLIKSTISKYIDPKESMTDFVREKASEEVRNRVEEKIMSDARFRSYLDRMWQRAITNNFSDESKTQIRNALIKKAQEVIGPILHEVRSKALKGISSKRRVNDNKEEDLEPIEKRPERKQMKSSGNSKPAGNLKKEYPKGMSTKDILAAELD